MEISLLAYFTKVYTTFFAIIGPIDLAVIFAVMTVKNTPKEQRTIAFRGCLTGFFILLFFAVFGTWLIQSIGITIPAIKISGGALLMYIGWGMVFDDMESMENTSYKKAKDIAVFPIGIPLIAGAGAISATILFSAENPETPHMMVLVASIIGVLITTYSMFVLAGRIQKIMNPIFMDALTRVMGILVIALAFQFILDGLKQAELFTPLTG